MQSLSHNLCIGVGLQQTQFNQAFVTDEDLAWNGEYILNETIGPKVSQRCVLKSGSAKSGDEIMGQII